MNKTEIAPVSLNFSLPNLYCPFHSSINSHAEEIERGTRAWVRAFKLVTEQSEHRFNSARFPVLVARAYPESPLESLQIVSDWIAWLFILDDQYDEGLVGDHPDELAAAHRRFVEILSGAPTDESDPPTGHALGDLCRRSLQKHPGIWFERFVRRISEYFDACVWEATNRARGTTPSVASYMEKRLSSGAVYPVVELFELSDGIMLTDAVRDHEVVRHLTRLANGVVCWSNDVISRSKEMKHGDVHNLVIVLRHEHSIPLQDAINRAAGIADADVKSFIYWEGRLPSFDPAEDAQVGRYVSRLRSWMRGNIDWSMASGRYRPGAVYSIAE